MKRVNPLVMHPLMHKGGAHIKSKSGERFRHKCNLNKHMEDWFDDFYDDFYDDCDSDGIETEDESNILKRCNKEAKGPGNSGSSAYIYLH